MALIGYARFSTRRQDLNHQVDQLTKAGYKDIFHGKQSGISDKNETKLLEMLNYSSKVVVIY